MTRCRRVFDADDDNLDGMVKDRSWLRGRYPRPIKDQFNVCLSASRNNSVLYIYNFMGLFIFILTETQCRNQFIYGHNFAISVAVIRD